MKQSKIIITQMLRMVYVLLLCIVIAPAFVSCSEDDDKEVIKENKSIIGAWTRDIGNGYQMCTFVRDGTYSEVAITDGVNIVWSYNGAYEIKDNIIYINPNPNSEFPRHAYTIIALTDTKLVLKTKSLYEGVDDGNEMLEYYRVE